MEKFKAVEKEMKTKAFSKEGLSAPGKRDPKEQEKEDAGDFLSDMIANLEGQIEAFEAEEERLLAAKKGKKDTSKADRLSEISRRTEVHRVHIGKLELLRRSLENGNIEAEQVQAKRDSIEYYVNDNASVDFMEEEPDDLYGDLDLQEDEGVFGLGGDNDRVSSQDAQSIADDLPEASESRDPSAGSGKPKSTSVSEPKSSGMRRTSNNLKSPLPALATLHTPMPTVPNGAPKDTMKPAPLPMRAPGETLKYASAAAAAAATDKAVIGIAPLPPPPGAAHAPNTSAPSAPPGLSAAPQTQKSSAATSPSAVPSLPVSSGPTPSQSHAMPVAGPSETFPNKPRSPTANHTANERGPGSNAQDPTSQAESIEGSRSVSGSTMPPPPKEPPAPMSSDPPSVPTPAKAPVSRPVDVEPIHPADDESIYHLPPGLQDLIHSFEITKARAPVPESLSVQRLLAHSQQTRPDYLDAEKPRHYRPETKYITPSYYPQEPFSYADDPSLYSKMDQDNLFYIFYYRQNTYQQYMAAKALKSQSWRFHKQYQTWFQRHEEPKTITEEFEQGTYRFFDYESTWYDHRSRPRSPVPSSAISSVMPFADLLFSWQDESTEGRLQIRVQIPGG